MEDRDVEGEGRPEEDVGTDGTYVMRIDYIYFVYDIGRSIFRNLSWLCWELSELWQVQFSQYPGEKR